VTGSVLCVELVDQRLQLGFGELTPDRLPNWYER
jgi:hypothetical protein